MLGDSASRREPLASDSDFRRAVFVRTGVGDFLGKPPRLGREGVVADAASLPPYPKMTRGR